jgi:hypothetical protein
LSNGRVGDHRRCRGRDLGRRPVARSARCRSPRIRFRCRHAAGMTARGLRCGSALDRLRQHRASTRVRGPFARAPGARQAHPRGTVEVGRRHLRPGAPPQAHR